MSTFLPKLSFFIVMTLSCSLSNPLSQSSSDVIGERGTRIMERQADGTTNNDVKALIYTGKKLDVLWVEVAEVASSRRDFDIIMSQLTSRSLLPGEILKNDISDKMELRVADDDDLMGTFRNRLYYLNNFKDYVSESGQYAGYFHEQIENFRRNSLEKDQVLARMNEINRIMNQIGNAGSLAQLPLTSQRTGQEFRLQKVSAQRTVPELTKPVSLPKDRTVLAIGYMVEKLSSDLRRSIESGEIQSYRKSFLRLVALERSEKNRDYVNRLLNLNHRDLVIDLPPYSWLHVKLRERHVGEIATWNQLAILTQNTLHRKAGIAGMLLIIESLKSEMPIDFGKILGHVSRKEESILLDQALTAIRISEPEYPMELLSSQFDAIFQSM